MVFQTSFLHYHVTAISHSNSTYLIIECFHIIKGIEYEYDMFYSLLLIKFLFIYFIGNSEKKNKLAKRDQHIVEKKMKETMPMVPMVPMVLMLKPNCEEQSIPK